MKRWAALALAMVLAAGTIAARELSSTQDATSAVMVERAGRYVEEYERAFAAIVSEEHQVQKVLRADGSVRKTRVLRSDFLLIKTGPAWAHVFRDVIEVDGKPVRNREDRLRKLFLEKPGSALPQAQAIMKESGRHNIGVSRSGNSPLLPRLFLHPRESARSRFTLAADSLTFEELRTPTVVRTKSGRRMTYDLPARGSFVIEPATGRVLSGEFTALGPSDSYSVTLSVRYAEDQQLKLMVPTNARELYWFNGKPKEDRLDVESAYSNFRRFQVTVNEEIRVPKF
jgi:hypothetical protein